MTDFNPLPSRNSRFWLYAPFALVALICVAWVAAWFVICNNTRQALDIWLEQERSAGREWNCKDRILAGFPFRIEMSCAALDLKTADGTMSLGKSVTVAQIYRPRHIIVEATGPLLLDGPDGRVAANWASLSSSFKLLPTGLERASTVMKQGMIEIQGRGASTSIKGESLEIHMRPNPDKKLEQAYDVVVQARRTQIGALDAISGDTAPAELEIQAQITRFDPEPTPFRNRLERWHQAGGMVNLVLLNLSKGKGRLEANGNLRLDEERRPQGEFQVAADGWQGMMGALTSPKGFLGALSVPRAEDGLKTLPPVILKRGKLFIGPLALPHVALQAVY
jgi:hypothetical protein